MIKKTAAFITAAVIAAGALPVLAAGTGVDTALNRYDLGEFERPVEKLGRGLVAVKTDEGVYLSWRLLNSEDSHVGSAKKNVPFNIYRDGELIATEALTTNYTDSEGTMESVYSVAPVTDGVEGERCEGVSPLSTGSNYFDIQLNRPPQFTGVGEADPNYYVGDASCGDLDGDGEYEIIVKWECNPQDNSNNGVTGNVLLDAYKMDGEFLWRIDLGRNIRSGAHYTQFLVYDFDLDGQAELCCKTAPGSIDANGDYVNQASEDDEVRAGDNSAVYVDDGGRISEGPEYYTYFESDGTAADTVFYEYSRDSGDGYWGRDSGGNLDRWNRIDRYLGAVAYLDGETPAAINVRGYYDRTTVVGYTIENGRLTVAASHDTYDYGGSSRYGGAYSGQGNHNITVADVDGDGRDEVITGSICFDDDLSVKWSSGRGHGDALHIGDYDPTNPGFEYFSVHEGGGYTITESTTSSQGQRADFGMTVYRASDGEELAHYGNNRDTGRGVMANVGAGGYYQFWGAGTYAAMGDGVFNGTSIRGASSNFRIFWDGDLYDELLDGTSISDWNADRGRMSSIFNADGCTRINGTKANPSLQADLFGDWREEVVYPTEDNESLRVYTTTIPTSYKIQTLMHDAVYRAGVAAEQTAYNQPPHVGMYMAEETFSMGIENVEIKSLPNKTEYKCGEEIDTTGLTLEVEYEDGSKGEVSSDYTIAGYNTNNVGEQTLTVNYRGWQLQFTVEIITEFTYEGEVITGYSGSDSEVTVPEEINGVKVTQIAAGAFAGASFDKIMIPENIVRIGDGAIDGDVIVRCYEGSVAYSYAQENGLTTEIITNVIEMFVDVDYDSYEEKNMFQGTEVQTETKDGITYTVGGRSSGGDGQGGFVFTKDGDNGIVAAAAGRFSNGGRYAYMQLANAPSFSDNAVYSLSFDVKIDEPQIPGCGIQAVISDDTLNLAGDESTEVTSGIVTVTKEGLGIDYGQWYNYTVVVQNGTVYQILRTMSGDVISVDKVADGVSMVPEKISFIVLGNMPGNGQRSSFISLDNVRLATTENAVANATVTAVDNEGELLEGALVSFGAITGYTGADGTVNMLVPTGIYNITVEHEGWIAEHRTRIRGNSYSARIVVDKTLPDRADFAAEAGSTLYLEEDGTLAGQVDVVVTNSGDTDDTVIVMMALYNENGQLVDMDIEKGLEVKAGESSAVTFYGGSRENISSAVVYLWSDLAKMAPLDAAISVLGE